MNNGLTPVFIPLLFDPVTQRLHQPYLRGAAEPLSNLYQNLQQLQLQQMVPAVPTPTPFVSLAPGIVPIPGHPVPCYTQASGFSQPSLQTGGRAKHRRLSSPAGFVNVGRSDIGSGVGAGQDCDWSAVNSAKVKMMLLGLDDTCHDASRKTSSTSGFSELTESLAGRRPSMVSEEGRAGLRDVGDELGRSEQLRVDVGFSEDNTMMEMDDDSDSSPHFQFDRQIGDAGPHFQFNPRFTDPATPFQFNPALYGLATPSSVYYSEQRTVPVDACMFNARSAF